MYTPLPQLANYLHTTLANSRRSRKRWKKRKLGGGDPDMAFGGWVGGSMGVQGGRGGTCRWQALSWHRRSG